MAKDEVLATSKFYLLIGDYTDLIVKKVSGPTITFDTAGDSKSFGVRKDAASFMQATVTGVKSAKLTVEFVATQEDKKMHDWYRASHSAGGPTAGKGSSSGGERKDATLTVYNQKGDPAAEWKFSGVFPESYTTSKLEPGSTELFTEKVDFVYETCHRTK